MKTLRFKDAVYVGDPLNAVKIFNEKEVDELILLDVTATKEKREPDYDYINQIATECFMPVAYGGGVNSIEQFKKVIVSGIEKVVINSAASKKPDFVRQAADHFGSSSVVVAIDVKKDFFGRKQVYLNANGKYAEEDIVTSVKLFEAKGAGEIFLQSVDHDGTMNGYDTSLINLVASSVSIPVIACGGAGKLSDFTHALHAGASAVAAGSKFVFIGSHKAVLINYPSPQEILELTQ